MRSASLERCINKTSHVRDCPEVAKSYWGIRGASSDGRIAVATLIERPGICAVDPATGVQEDFAFPDVLTTNIVFGGGDMMDAWVCLSTSGRLARCRWPRPGLRLAHYG